MGKHVKSLISVLLAIVMICSMSAVVSAQAETLVDSGSLGNYYSWEYYSNDILKIYPTSGDVTFLADSNLTNHISEETKLVFDFSRADFGESSEYICFNGFDIQITNITLTGYNVNEINSVNISRFSTLRSVCFKEGTSLNTLEVYDCDSALTITNATIEKMIVYKCNGMEALSVPDCVKDLDVEYCDDLKNLTLSGNLESLSLVSLPNLKSLFIPSGLKSFNATEVGITNIYIPKTCEDFYIRHSSLKSATIESGRKSISDYMFYCCSELSSVSIPNSITSIGCDAFSGCSSLTSITIPDSVNFIDMYAFYNSGIETIAIPSGVSSLEPWTFCNCNNLTSVTIPETLEVLYDVAFLNSNSLTDVYYEGTREQWENIEIPDYEYTIDELFEGITVHYARSATLLASGTVNEYYPYTWEYYDNDVLKFYPTSSSSFILDINNLSTYVQNHFSGNTKVVLDLSNAVTYSYNPVGISIYGNNYQTKNITITGSKMDKFNSFSFYNFQSLQTVKIDNCPSLKYLRVENCGCSSIDLFKGANAVDYYVTDCQNLTYVIIPDYATNLDIRECNNVKQIAVSENTKTIHAEDLPALTSFDIPDTINDLYFRNVGLTGIVIPNNDANIRIDTATLENATIEPGRTVLNQSMFSSCTNLTEISIPDSVMKIDHSAFWDCTSLTSIDLPDSLNYIGFGTFFNTGFDSFTIPDGVSSINYCAFGWCENLSAVTIPDTVTVIDDRAFVGSASLKDIYFDGTRAQWESITITHVRNEDDPFSSVGTSDMSIYDVFEGVTVHFTGSLIETQPEDYTGPIGSTAKFTVVANGEGFKYQWQVLKNGTWTNCSINDGAKKATLSLEAKDSRNGSKYHCIVTDKNGKTETSNEVTLTVVTPLAITTQPEDYSGPVGDYAVFNVSAEGEGLKYQWQVLKNGTWTNCSKNDGAKTATFTQEIKDSRNGNVYQCVITDKYGDTVTTAEVTLTVKASLSIVEQPTNFSGSVGNTAKFIVEAHGEGLKYQWQVLKNGTWTNCSINDGARTNTLSLEIKESRNGCVYHCIVTDKTGATVTSDEVALTVCNELYIAAEPESQFAVSGQKASFTVEAEGDGVKYQWQCKKNGEWVNCSLNDGARTNTLTQAASASRDGREYHCVITDKYGNAATTRSVYLYIVSEDSLVPLSNSSTADSTVIEAEEAVEVSEETVDVVEPEVVEVIDTVEESVETESVA